MRTRVALMLVAVALARAAVADERSPDVATAPPAEQFIIVPLRVHVLTGDAPEVDCKLTDADVERIIGKVNGVWRVAGVHFGLESIVREPAAKVEQFKRVRDEIGTAPLGLYRVLRPERSRPFDGLHVYYVHRMPVNGVWMNDGFAFVQETASLREVEGGIDEPVPRVTSHELGHALGLPHRQDRTNLMASGTTGTLLNEEEVNAAKAKALEVKGAMRFEKCVKGAEGDERLKKWLKEILREGPSPSDRRTAE